MKTPLLIILIIFSVNLLFCQNKPEDCTLNGRVKVIINKTDTICPTDEPMIFINKKLYYRAIDSVGYFNISELKEGKYNIKILGWGYEVDTLLNIKHPLSYNLTFYANIDCEVNRVAALKDIEENRIKLLIIGSIAPMANTYHDNTFEKKYNLKYYDYGDTPPLFDCVRIYNEVIFEFLDLKYGEEWRNSVRKDVEGLLNE